MKKPSPVKMALLLALVFTVVTIAHAEDSSVFPSPDLSADQQKAMQKAGVPIYPGATYVGGNENVATVIWFGTTDSLKKIMDWYKRKLTGWSELNYEGVRIVYKGPEGLKFKDIRPYPYIYARIKDETVAENSEITIYLPR